MKPSEQHKVDLEKADQEYYAMRAEEDLAMRRAKFRFKLETARGKDLNADSLIFEGRTSFWVTNVTIVVLILVAGLNLGGIQAFLIDLVNGQGIDIRSVLIGVLFVVGLFCASWWNMQAKLMLDLGQQMKVEKEEK